MSSTPSLLRTFSVSVIRTAVCLSGLLNACFGVHYPSQGARDTKALDVGLTSLFLFFSFSCQEMLSLTPVRQVAPALFAAYATPKLSLVAWLNVLPAVFGFTPSASSYLQPPLLKLPSHAVTAFTVPFEAFEPSQASPLALVRSSSATPLLSILLFVLCPSCLAPMSFLNYMSPFPPSRRPSLLFLRRFTILTPIHLAPVLLPLVFLTHNLLLLYLQQLPHHLPLL